MNDNKDLRSLEERIAAAKDVIFAYDGPVTAGTEILVNLAEQQIAPLVKLMEEELQSPHVDSSVHRHVEYVETRYPNSDVKEMESLIGTDFFSAVCARFASYYKPRIAHIKPLEYVAS